MPLDDTQTKRQRPLLSGEHGEWTEHYREITGEPFSPGSFENRIHPDDRERVLRAWTSAQDSGRFDECYRICNAAGQFVKVHGLARRIVEWVGVIEIATGPTDKANMRTIIPFHYHNIIWIGIALSLM